MYLGRSYVANDPDGALEGRRSGKIGKTEKELDIRDEFTSEMNQIDQEVHEGET